MAVETNERKPVESSMPQNGRGQSADRVKFESDLDQKWSLFWTSAFPILPKQGSDTIDFHLIRLVLI